MKHIFILLSVVLLLSCSSDEGGDSIVEPGSSSIGNMYAIIHGEDFTADEVKAYQQSNYTYIEGIQDVSNSSATYSEVKIKISIQDLKEPLLFGIGENGQGLIYYAHSTLTYTLKDDETAVEYKGHYVENLSLINITEYNDKRISGTFGFRAVDSDPESQDIDIEQGRFNITF